MKLKIILKKLKEVNDPLADSDSNNNFRAFSYNHGSVASTAINSRSLFSPKDISADDDLVIDYPCLGIIGQIVQGQVLYSNNNNINNVNNLNNNNSNIMSSSQSITKNAPTRIQEVSSNKNIISNMNSISDTSSCNNLHLTNIHNNITSSNKIADVKYAFSIQTGFRADSISLFTYADPVKKINDNEDVINYCKNELENDKAENKPTPSIIFFYKLHTNPKDSLRIIIEYFQNNIDKLIFDLNPNCQVYFLKYLINKRLSNALPISEQSIIFQSLASTIISRDQNGRKIQKIQTLPDNKLMSKSAKEVKDDSSLGEITTNFNTHNSNQSVNLINFLLIRKGERRCSIGLDFSFTLMKNISKVAFVEEAPSFREVSDGLNIFCYCRNKNCKLFNQMFVRNLGYNKFDIMREIRYISCPLCSDNKKVEARNIGFVNCEWSYRGILLNKNSSLISGDGITIDNKLYVMKETNLNTQIDRIEITVKTVTINYAVDVNEHEDGGYKKFKSKDISKDGIIGKDVSKDANVNKDVNKSNNNYVSESNSSSVDSLEDMDVHFSIKRKDLFENHKTKKVTPNISNNNTIGKIIISDNCAEVDNSLISHTDTSKDELEIKLDCKTKNSCCFGYSNILGKKNSDPSNNFSNDKHTCLIY